jgi:hypothetical protein
VRIAATLAVVVVEGKGTSQAPVCPGMGALEDWRIGGLECWSVGVLECWSVGGWEDGRMGGWEDGRMGSLDQPITLLPRRLTAPKTGSQSAGSFGENPQDR